MAPERICGNCGSVDTDRTQRPVFRTIFFVYFVFNTAVMFLLMLFSHNPFSMASLIISGLVCYIFYLLMANGTKQVCRACKSSMILDITTPAGKELYKKYHNPPSE